MSDIKKIIQKSCINLTLKSYFIFVVSSFVLCVALPFAKIKYDFTNRKKGLNNYGN